MTSLCVAAAFHRRHHNTLPLLRRVLVESTRVPDETWVVCEDDHDAQIARDAARSLVALNTVKIAVVPTPKGPDGYKVVPYSHKHNWVLDRSEADLFTYLDNGSMPDPDKYRVMCEAFSDLSVGAVYCAQQRDGHDKTLFLAEHPIPDGFCVLNHTQVMHRATDARWPENPSAMNVGDGLFWRELSKRFGPIIPVGETVLDYHLIDGPGGL